MAVTFEAPRELDAEAAAFYARFGFEQSPVNERQMMVLMKDLRQFFI